MENVLLVRYGEIHLKGLNRPYFERKLVERIKFALREPGARIIYAQGRIYAWNIPENVKSSAIERLQRVFGIHSISPAVSVAKDWETICSTAKELLKDALSDGKRHTFKVFARRADKKFPMTSMEICCELGGYLLNEFDNISVDVHDPELKICVEVRENALLYTEEFMGAGGMPTGTAGRGTLLISGGIDSPVAGYMLAKRGLELSAVHFYSYPYTSERARDKVIELAKILSTHSGEIKLHLVPFTDIQLAIYEKCPPKETTIIMRRLMMRIAERLAKADGSLALITGEALGQVASQTLQSLCVTDDAVSMPVFRPLIGFDKEEITAIAKRIGTFETSIMPYEDCCTVFVPQHPVTKPEVEDIRKSETAVDFTEMIEQAIKDTEVIELGRA